MQRRHPAPSTAADFTGTQISKEHLQFSPSKVMLATPVRLATPAKGDCLCPLLLLTSRSLFPPSCLPWFEARGGTSSSNQSPPSTSSRCQLLLPGSHPCCWLNIHFVQAKRTLQRRGTEWPLECVLVIWLSIILLWPFQRNSLPSQLAIQTCSLFL